jgi:hypothetical protein
MLGKQRPLLTYEENRRVAMHAPTPVLVLLLTH